MKKRVRILLSAQRDLAEIDAYVRREAAGSAEQKIQDILLGIERLGELPESGPVARDERLRRLGFRYLIRGRYLIFYKVTPTQVRIYRVLHQRRAYERLL